MNGRPILGNKTKVAIYIYHQKTKTKQGMIIPNEYNCALASKEGYSNQCSIPQTLKPGLLENKIGNRTSDFMFFILD